MRDAASGDAAVVEAARSALLETTPGDTIGDVIGLDEVGDGVLDVRFGTTMPGYPGWSWAVYVSVLDGADEPSVLELSLLPGEDALVAPEWVPWSDRLADYRAAQDAKDGELGDDEDEDADEDDLLDDEDDVLDGVEFEDAEGDHDEELDELDDDVLDPIADDEDDDVVGRPGPGDGESALDDDSEGELDVDASAERVH